MSNTDKKQESPTYTHRIMTEKDGKASVDLEVWRDSPVLVLRTVGGEDLRMPIRPDTTHCLIQEIAPRRLDMRSMLYYLFTGETTEDAAISKMRERAAGGDAEAARFVEHFEAASASDPKRHFRPNRKRAKA